jgi:predicted RNA-binding Zn ribbon-like protein
MTKMAKKPEPEFDLSGGVLCLDFANTVSERGSPKRSWDYLLGYDDLIEFARDEGILTSREARAVLVKSLTKPQERARVHRTAITLLEAIYRVFAAQAKSWEGAPDDVKMIEEFAREAIKHRQLSYSGGQYQWKWKSEKDEILGWVLWPIAESAAELLTSAEIERVRTCAAPKCEWLFLDDSRNHSRRWCDMSVCGNRQKARRHYERQQT